MVDIGKIFNECENALGDAMRTLYEDRPDYFLLFLSQGEYNHLCKNIEGLSPYMTDYTWDFQINTHQRNCIVHYLNRNYRKPGFSYSEDNIDDLITEMMLYSHIWEDICFLKFLLRLSLLIDGQDYLWITDLEYHTDLYETIQDQIIAPLKKKGLHLGELIASSYSSNIRNSFSHSMYSIDVNRRMISLWGGRTKDKSWNQDLTFEEFQEKFLKSVRIWNTLFHLIDECRRNAALGQSTSGLIPLESEKVLQIWAEMRKRGDVLEPCFRGKVFCSGEKA